MVFFELACKGHGIRWGLIADTIRSPFASRCPSHGCNWSMPGMATLVKPGPDAIVLGPSSAPVEINKKRKQTRT